MEEVQFNNIQFKVLIIHQLEWFNLNTELLKKLVKRNKQEMIEEEQLQEHMDLLIQDIQDQVQRNKYPHIKHMKEAQVDIMEQHNFRDNQQDIVEFLNLQDNLDWDHQVLVEDHLFQDLELVEHINQDIKLVEI